MLLTRGVNVLGQLLFVIGNALAVYIAIIAANITMQEREPWRRTLAIVSGFSITVLITLLILGIAGQLTAVSAVLFLSIVSIFLLALQKHKWGKNRYNPSKESGYSGVQCVTHIRVIRNGAYQCDTAGGMGIDIFDNQAARINQHAC